MAKLTNKLTPSNAFVSSPELVIHHPLPGRRREEQISPHRESRAILRQVPSVISLRSANFHNRVTTRTVISKDHLLWTTSPKEFLSTSNLFRIVDGVQLKRSAEGGSFDGEDAGDVTRGKIELSYARFRTVSVSFFRS